MSLVFKKYKFDVNYNVLTKSTDVKDLENREDLEFLLIKESILNFFLNKVIGGSGFDLDLFNTLSKKAKEDYIVSLCIDTANIRLSGLILEGQIVTFFIDYVVGNNVENSDARI